MKKQFNIIFFIFEDIAYSCNFDNGWCGWIFSPRNNKKYRWQRETGSTDPDDTGPSEDHTSGCELMS